MHRISIYKEYRYWIKKVTRLTTKSFLSQITHIESIVRLIKDDFLRERLMPDLNNVNLAISELESLHDFLCNQETGCTYKDRKAE